MFSRLVGSAKPVDKLISLDLQELDATKVPNCSALCIECKRKDRFLRSKEIHVYKGMKFPITINS